MQRICRDKLAVLFDQRLKPVASVKPGEIFIVETEDDRGGRTRTPATTTPEFLLAMRAEGWNGNPVTGPIFIEGANAGDTLAVHILHIKCDSVGQVGYWPDMFRLHEFFDGPNTTLVEVRDGLINLLPGLQLPVRPMIGTIGTAPVCEAIYTGRQGQHGGNLDIPEVTSGTTLYLPVEVSGALLGFGDCHAIQGDGELNEVEIRGEVTLRCEVIKGRRAGLRWPYLETADSWVTIAAARPLEEAAVVVLHEMIRLIIDITGLDAHSAYLLAGVAGHVRPGQIQGGLYTMRCLLRKEYMARVTRRF